MFDFRLKVFFTVVKRGSFTKAAQELLISQPAVSKHIKEIEQYYQTTLFTRMGNSVVPTTSGLVLYNYVLEILTVHRNIEYDMLALNGKSAGNLYIGASTTVSQYVLPALLALFKQKYTAIQFNVVSGNSQEIETLLLEQKIDMGITEGSSRNALIKYTELVDDKIVVVARDQHPLLKQKHIELKQLMQLPFLLREYGSGTLEVVERHIEKLGYCLADLHSEMSFSSTESIKMYLQHSDSLAFISKAAISKELLHKELAIIQVKDLEICRKFNVIHRLGQQSKLVDTLSQFILSHNI